MFCKGEHRQVEGFKKIVQYINVLNKPIKADKLITIVQEHGELPLLALPPVPLHTSVKIPSPWWVVGFIVGDGSFSYSKVTRVINNSGEKRSVFHLVLSANQLKMDKYILISIANFLGCGAVYTYEVRPTSELRLVGLNVILHIILPFFHKYLLFGYKFSQYELWQKAALINIGQPKYSKTKEAELNLLMDNLSKLSGYIRIREKLSSLRCFAHALKNLLKRQKWDFQTH